MSRSDFDLVVAVGDQEKQAVINYFKWAQRRVPVREAARVGSAPPEHPCLVINSDLGQMLSSNADVVALLETPGMVVTHLSDQLELDMENAESREEAREGSVSLGKTASSEVCAGW